MATVIANLSMSLDGFIADLDDGCDELFGWYGNGDVAVTAGGRTGYMTQTNAAVFRQALESAGVYLVGRRLYDHTNGWNGRPPSDVPMVVVTHEPPADYPRDGVPITFVADGIGAAVAQAQAIAGDRVVAVAGATTARACLAAGLLDEIYVNLIPVVLGAGIPFFAGVADGPYRLEDPEIIAGEGVTHLRYRVKH